MAADVVFTAEDPWYTSSESWYEISEFALGGLEGRTREEYEGLVSGPLGIDFTFLSDDKAVEVARWLSGALEKMLAAGTWEDERSRAFIEELARKLRSEIHARSSK
jgi:hypothetical protein